MALAKHPNYLAKTKKGLEAQILDNEIIIPKEVFENHILNNVLLTLTIAVVAEIEPENAIEAILKLEKPKGRGQYIKLKNKAVIIDDSYNASPTSMKLALEKLNEQKAKRKIAVLGDMRELGVFSRDYHEELADYIGNINMVITCGEEMKNLHKLLKRKKLDARHFDNIENTKNFLDAELKEGDLALIKGSHGSNMYKIVDMIVGK